MRSSIKRLRKTVNTTDDFQTWYDAAKKLDEILGNDDWKASDFSRDYNFQLVKKQLTLIRKFRTEGKTQLLVNHLRAGLLRNLGNLANDALYTHSMVGTKYIIDDYVSVVISALDYLCDSDLDDFNYAEKMKFFVETGQSFGRSALMLSGGANMGFFHLGIVKSLFERKLLPRVISGASIGSVIAAATCVRSNEDLPQMFDINTLNIAGWRRLSPSEMWHDKSFLDNSNLEECIRDNVGDMTFQEAFDHTGRMLNIPVSPVSRNQVPRILNYLTVPNVYVWSACLASCAFPGLFPPVRLTAKDNRSRQIPYMPTIRWVDGSLKNDLPLTRLSELYNVNHTIVSQANPHIAPFLSHHSSKKGIFSFASNVLKGEIEHRSLQALKIMRASIPNDVVAQVIDGAHAMIAQDYYGDITIYPKLEIADYFKLFHNISQATIEHYMRAGERATWTRIARIRNQCKIGQTLESCIQRLKSKRNEPDAQSRNPA